MEIRGDKTKVGLYLSGQEVEVPGANIFITQPTIKQITAYGEDEFLISVNILVKTEKILDPLREGNSGLEMYPDFQLLMIVLREDISIQTSILGLFELIFPKYEVEFTEIGMNFYLVQEDEEEENGSTKIFVGQLHPYNFEIFQNLLFDLFTIHSLSEEEEREFNPADEAAAAIAKKLQRGRQKRATIRGPQSIIGIYTSVLSIGLGVGINTFFDYTLFQLCDAYSRFFSKQQSDFYLRVSTMPFMDVSKMETPEEWSRHLY